MFLKPLNEGSSPAALKFGCSLSASLNLKLRRFGICCNKFTNPLLSGISRMSHLVIYVRNHSSSTSIIKAGKGVNIRKTIQVRHLQHSQLDQRVQHQDTR